MSNNSVSSTGSSVDTNAAVAGKNAGVREVGKLSSVNPVGVTTSNRQTATEPLTSPSGKQALDDIIKRTASLPLGVGVIDGQPTKDISEKPKQGQPIVPPMTVLERQEHYIGKKPADKDVKPAEDDTPKPTSLVRQSNSYSGTDARSKDPENYL